MFDIFQAQTSHPGGLFYERPYEYSNYTRLYATGIFYTNNTIMNFRNGLNLASLWDFSTAFDHVHLDDISKWPYDLRDTEILATSTLPTGSYIMVVDNAGNVTKKLISL